MPPRKSDQRKSDVSVARFALKDDVAADTSTASASAPAPAAAPSTPPPQSAAAPASTAASVADQDASQEKKTQQQAKDADTTAIEDLTLPKSIITRLAKGVLPANTQIQANAILAMSKSTTVFVNYLASYANEHTTNAGKKTIAPADVFKALDDVEFDFLRPRLEAEFAKFNAIQTEKRTSYRNKVKASKSDPNASGLGDTSMADTTMASNPDGPSVADATTLSSATNAGEDSSRTTKKQRIDPTAGAGEEQDDAETEDEQPIDDDEDMQDDDVEEEDEEEEDEDGQGGSGDETQDALEERNGAEEQDEALDGDDSD